MRRASTPQNTLKAVQRACELIELLHCGEVVEGVIDVIPQPLKETTVKLESDKINALLGTDIDEGTMREILEREGFTLEGDNDPRPLVARRRQPLLRRGRGGRPFLRL